MKRMIVPGGIVAVRVTALLVAVGITGLSVGAALAGVHSFPTTFEKFEYKNDADSKPQFSGKIASPPAPCVRRRDVKLFRKKKGDSKNVGSDTTGRVKGRSSPTHFPTSKFKIKLSNDPPKSGKYYAEVEEKKVNPDTICHSDQTGRIKIS